MYYYTSFKLEIMQYYHVSSDNQGNKKFKPRIPDLKMDDEDGITKRVCFSTSIIGCLSAINVEEYITCIDRIFYVHVPIGYRGKIHKPTKKEVPDVIETREKWFLNTVKLKCIGKIKIYPSHRTKHGITFKWIEKYDNKRRIFKNVPND